jgi:hypothetical protein
VTVFEVSGVRGVALYVKPVTLCGGGLVSVFDTAISVHANAWLSDALVRDCSMLFMIETAGNGVGHDEGGSVNTIASAAMSLQSCSSPVVSVVVSCNPVSGNGVCAMKLMVVGGWWLMVDG